MADDDDLPPDQEEDDLLPTEQATVDAGDRTAVKERVRQAKRDGRKAEDFWKAMLADEVGRREVWLLLADAHTFNPSFACGPNGFPQPEATWFEAGKQAFGLALYHKLAALDRANILLMHDEHDPRFPKRKPARAKRDDQ